MKQRIVQVESDRQRGRETERRRRNTEKREKPEQALGEKNSKRKRELSREKQR